MATGCQKDRSLPPGHPKKGWRPHAWPSRADVDFCSVSARVLWRLVIKWMKMIDSRWPWYAMAPQLTGYKWVLPPGSDDFGATRFSVGYVAHPLDVRLFGLPQGRSPPCRGVPRTPAMFVAEKNRWLCGAAADVPVPFVLRVASWLTTSHYSSSSLSFFDSIGPNYIILYHIIFCNWVSLFNTATNVDSWSSCCYHMLIPNFSYLLIHGTKS